MKRPAEAPVAARVLVTGATGFVGRATSDALLARGADVLGAVRAPDRAEALRDGVRPVVVGDLARPVEWAGALGSVDAVIHLAARVHVMRDSAADAEAAYRRLNVDATLELARAAAAAGVRRFVYVSSVKAAAERSGARPLTERDPPAPEDAYGRSKLAAEQALGGVAHGTGMEVVIVRPPLVYGPGVGGNFARLAALVRLAARVPLPLRSANRRSLVYVGNLADALGTVAVHPGAAGGTYFVRDGDDLSTADLLRQLGAPVGIRPRLIPAPVRLMRAAAAAAGREAVVSRLLGTLQVDDAALRRDYRWRAPFDLPTALGVTARALFAR